MTAPKTQIVQMTVQNPDATMPLIIPVLVVCNTSDADLERNVRVNSQRDLEWIERGEARDEPAVIVGGAPSLKDKINLVVALQRWGGTVFALNGASRFLNEHGIFTDYQVIADAKPETAQLVDPSASAHLFASQVNPLCFEVENIRPKLWHLQCGDIETWFPEEKVAAGGYCMVGSGAAVGTAACALAYAVGYRKLHVFGMDSCHRNGASHAYQQPMNDLIPNVDVEWAGKRYKSSVAMKAQAEKFMMTGQDLVRRGCQIHVYGEGLLQAMWHTPPTDLTERDKYRLMWQFDGYREIAPGEYAVETFLEVARPSGLVIDFGCGTGRAGLKLKEAGLNVLLVDFADNCRDEEAMGLPFLEWDLAWPCPAQANYGFCTDVMEHIPPDDLETVTQNIMAAGRTVFFQISTTADLFGAVLQQPLHLSIHSHEWWLNVFTDLGFTIAWERKGEIASSFLVTQSSQKGN